MSVLKQAKTAEEIKKLGVSSVRQEYEKLAQDYNKILDRDVLLCPCCGDFLKADALFYFDKRYATNRYPICRRCIQKMVEQRSSDKDEPNETKESVQKVLQMMDKVYDDTFYSDCIKGAQDSLKEQVRTSPFSTYITAIQSLPQWKGKTWKDSDFGDSGISFNEEEVKVSQRLLRDAKKRFGSSYGNEDLMFLENQYEDWVARYECNTKAQEEIFERLAFKKWEINKATKSGQPTKDLDKTYQDLLATANIQPRQSSVDSLGQSQTLGTLLQKYEETRPLPEIDPELKDVDKIGLYFDIFFRGHASKMLGLKNNFSNLYEKYMAKYTVKKPEYSGDSDSEVIFESIFGSQEDE